MVRKFVPVLLFVIFISLLTFVQASIRAIAQDQGTPQPTATVSLTPQSGGNSIRGTIAAVSDTDVTINVGNRLVTIPVSEDIPIVRNGKPSTLSELQATENISVQRDKNGKVLSVIVWTSTPTQVVQPTVVSSPTVSPTSISATPTPTERIVTGTITSVGNNSINVSGDDGKTYNFSTSAANLQITKNGQTVTVSQLNAGDSVVVTLNANGNPVRIEATSVNTSGGGFNPRWVLFPILMLLPFVLLLLLLINKPANAEENE